MGDRIDLICKTCVSSKCAARWCANQVQEIHPTLVRVKSMRTKLVTMLAKQELNAHRLRQGCHPRYGIAIDLFAMAESYG